MLLSRETEIGYRRFINEIDTVEKPPFNRRESAFPPRSSSMLLLFFFIGQAREQRVRGSERERERKSRGFERGTSLKWWSIDGLVLRGFNCVWFRKAIGFFFTISSISKNRNIFNILNDLIFSLILIRKFARFKKIWFLAKIFLAYAEQIERNLFSRRRISILEFFLLRLEIIFL